MGDRDGLSGVCAHPPAVKMIERFARAESVGIGLGWVDKAVKRKVSIT